MALDYVPLSVKIFIALLVFLLLSSLPLPTLIVEKGTYNEKVSIVDVPDKVRLTITLREESPTKDFTLDDRLEEIEDYVENYSVVPSLYSYKDRYNNTVYVLTYRIEAVMDVNEVALQRIVELADSLSASFLKDTKALEAQALERATWQPEGFILKHEMEANCPSYHPIPLYEAKGGLQPGEREELCTVSHTYEVLRVEWKTVYQLLQGLLPRV